MKHILFLICILFVSTATTASITPKNGISHKIYTVLSDKTDFNKKANRQLLATLLIKQLNDLDLLIPYNTPAENDWLEKERSQYKGSTERLINLISTPIFAKDWLKDRISYTRGLLKENQSNGISLKQETLNWINISLTLNPQFDGFNENLSIVVHNKIVSKKILKDLIHYATTNGYIYSDFKFFSRDILVYIVPELIRSY